MSMIWPRVVLVSIPETYFKVKFNGISLQDCLMEILGVERRMKKGLLREKEAASLVAWMDQARSVALRLIREKKAIATEVPGSSLKKWFEAARLGRQGASSMFLNDSRLIEELDALKRQGTPAAKYRADFIDRATKSKYVLVEVVE